MNYEQEKKRYISFCGSYCHHCDWFTGRIRETFQSALDMLETYRFSKLLKGKIDEKNFKKGLQILSQSGICPGCKAEIAEKREEDRCSIRQCCYAKGFDLCLECAEFPCELLRTNPGVIKFGCIQNLEEIKENGLHSWMDKQWREFASF